MADSAYPLLKTLHVLGAVLLLGNVTVTGAWSLFLYGCWKRDEIAFGPIARAILWTDLVFTVSGGALLTFTGIQLALKLRLPFPETRWLAEGVGALALATLLWLLVLLPDQLRMERTTDPARLRRLFLRWSVVGWLSTAILFFGLWAMVSKR